jgi:hypothetical protein
MLRHPNHTTYHEHLKFNGLAWESLSAKVAQGLGTYLAGNRGLALNIKQSALNLFIQFIYSYHQDVQVFC